MPPISIAANCAQHSCVCKAAARQTTQSLANFLIGCFWLCVQQCFCGQNHPAQAVPALRGAFLDKGLLNGMRFLRRTQTFKCRNRLPAHAANRFHTGTNNLRSDHHCTGAALRHAAPETRPIQVKLVGQHKQQWSLGINLDCLALTIHQEDLFHRTPALHLIHWMPSIHCVALP